MLIAFMCITSVVGFQTNYPLSTCFFVGVIFLNESIKKATCEKRHCLCLKLSILFFNFSMDVFLLCFL
ncbi:hypothetical protein RBTH_07750 [Bacillus thuringiensis serovar israelensis ATCC 35646]|nr:hypothetical protein RBTH_07750 [Bacillus thuringiensis serovar israelensis ATCC 35646]